jgi:signal transduction histidine kinase
MSIELLRMRGLIPKRELDGLLPLGWIDTNLKTILVIDDDAVLRGSIISGLKTNGFRVLQAATSGDGINIARKEAPDLILCDLNLGEANDTGALTLLHTHPATAGVPFLLMTGQPWEKSQRDEVLVKPFTLAALLQAIHRQLGQLPVKRSSEAKSGVPSLSAMNSGASAGRLKPSAGQLADLLARVQSLREKERTHVARRIHDHLSQTLTVVAIELSLLDSSLSSAPKKVAPGEYLPAVRKLTGLVNNLIQSAQEITAQLRPKVLDEFGFLAALEWLAQQVEKKTGMTCQLFVDGLEETLDPAAAEHLYRLSEEILSNAARHAHATAVSIRVANQEGFLCLEIKDNGKGIRSHEIDDPASLGLLAMRERAEQLHGFFQVKGFPGKGTTIRVRIPLKV